MTSRTRVAGLFNLTLFLLLSEQTYAQPFIYVANAGDDTVSKIDVTLNQVAATYRTWFGPGPVSLTNPNVFVPTPHGPWAGPAPSRIAVDFGGNVYVLDRFFGPNAPSFPCSPATSPSCHLPVLLKILPYGSGTTSTSS